MGLWLRPHFTCTSHILSFIMEAIQLADIHKNEQIPKSLKHSRSVYICNNWTKICVFMLLILILFIREIIILITEENIISKIYTLYTNKSIVI